MQDRVVGSMLKLHVASSKLRCCNGEVNVPYHSAEAEKDNATLDRAIRSAEEVGYRPGVAVWSASVSNAVLVFPMVGVQDVSKL
jgi:hypothetical protein